MYCKICGKEINSTLSGVCESCASSAGIKNKVLEEQVEERSGFSFEELATWEVGEVIDVGPLEEFREWVKAISLKSLEDAIILMLGYLSEDGKKVIDRVGAALDNVHTTEKFKQILFKEVESFRQDGFSPDIVIKMFLDQYLYDVMYGFSIKTSASYKDLIVEMKKKDENAENVFVESIVDKIVSAISDKQTSYKKFTKYNGQYKGIPVLLTGDDRYAEKEQVGGRFMFRNSKYVIIVRQEAYEILKAEESRGIKALINEVLEHEYQEIMHKTDPDNVASPHTEHRSRKYLEVLKVLRKRKYFHDLVT